MKNKDKIEKISIWKNANTITFNERFWRDFKKIMFLLENDLFNNNNNEEDFSKVINDNYEVVKMILNFFSDKKISNSNDAQKMNYKEIIKNIKKLVNDNNIIIDSYNKNISITMKNINSNDEKLNHHHDNEKSIKYKKGEIIKEPRIRSVVFLFLESGTFFITKGTGLKNNKIYEAIDKNFWGSVFYKDNLLINKVEYKLWNLSIFLGFKFSKSNESKEINEQELFTNLFEINQEGYNSILGSKFFDIEKIYLNGTVNEGNNYLKEYFGKEKKEIEISNKISFSYKSILKDDFNLNNEAIDQLINIINKMCQNSSEEFLMRNKEIKKFFTKIKDSNIFIEQIKNASESETHYLEIHFIDKNNLFYSRIINFDELNEIDEFVDLITDILENKDIEKKEYGINKFVKFITDILENNYKEIIKKTIGIKLLKKENDYDNFYYTNNIKNNKHSFFRVKSDSVFIANLISDWVNSIRETVLWNEENESDILSQKINYEKNTKDIKIENETDVNNGNILLGINGYDFEILKADQIEYKPNERDGNRKIELADWIIIQYNDNGKEEIKAIFMIHLKEESGRDSISNVFNQILLSKNVFEKIDSYGNNIGVFLGELLEKNNDANITEDKLKKWILNNQNNSKIFFVIGLLRDERKTTNLNKIRPIINWFESLQESDKKNLYLMDLKVLKKSD